MLPTNFFSLFNDDIYPATNNWILVLIVFFMKKIYAEKNNYEFKWLKVETYQSMMIKVELPLKVKD